MATIRSTTGSLLGTVTSAASTVTALISAAEQGTALLTNRINHNLQEQEERLALEAAERTDRLLDEMAESAMDRKYSLAKKLAGDSAKEALFNEARAKLQAALNK